MKIFKLTIITFFSFLSVFVWEGTAKQTSSHGFSKHFHPSSQAGGEASLENFQVLAVDSVVGDTTFYTIRFALPEDAFQLLGYGGYSFNFPEGYDLSRLEVVEVLDDCPYYGYRVTGFWTDENLVSVTLSPLYFKKRGFSPPVCDTVTVSVLFKSIRNPLVAERYQVMGIAFDADSTIVAGPSLSGEFSIIPAELASVEIIPAGDTVIKAGDVISFAAVGSDRYGNPIADVEFQWSLAPEYDSIGVLSGSVLQAKRVGVGQVIVTADSFQQRSGLITVVPRDLSRLDLVVSPSQVVGQPFIAPAAVTLYDEYDNLVTNYSLADNPIGIVPDQGMCVPDVINDSSLLVDGTISLTDAGITFLGSTGEVTLFAVNNAISSAPVTVSFNGYDILQVMGALGLPLTVIYADADNTAYVAVQNNGTLTALTSSLKVTFASGSDTSEVSFTPHALGVIDTVAVPLPAAPGSVFEDTLVFELASDYTIGGNTYTTRSGYRHPVIVIQPYTFEVVSSSFKPDTVYPGRAFSFSFEIDADGFSGSIDRTDVTIAFTQGAATEVMYQGSPEYVSFEDSVIHYSDLPAVVPPGTAFQPGWLGIDFDYQLTFGSITFDLSVPLNDSVYLLPELQLGYVPQSLTPLEIFAGTETSFGFDIELANDFPVAVALGEAQFTVSGSNFLSTTNIFLTGDSLYPGENHIESGSLFIPLNQLGESLQVHLSLPVVIPGVGDTLLFETTFDDAVVTVGERPSAQIVDMDIIAPNAPYVNTSQPFQISCRVANLSATPLDSLQLGMRSYGASQFDSLQVIPFIAPNDTVQVIFDVIASTEANAGEIFKTDVVSTDIEQYPSDSNVVLVVVQDPARLQLSYHLEGVTDYLVGKGEDFKLIVELSNSGHSFVSEGTFRLTTDSVYFGMFDPIEGTIVPDQPLTLSFTAPMIDTTVTFAFSLIERPTDLNVQAPALVVNDDTSFAFDIRVVTLGTDVYVEPMLTTSNLVLPGSRKELFCLRLTNNGTSPLTSVFLSKIALTFRRSDGLPANTEEIIDPNATHFYEDSIPVSQTIVFNGFALSNFDNFIIEPGETRTIAFVAQFRDELPATFVLTLEKHHISVLFREGPNAGQPAELTSPIDDENLISRVYVIKGKSLKESFLVENNPFNPVVGEARFSYELEQPSSVEFRVFTLTGEEVYARDLLEGTEGTAAGENEIMWDGRNNAGHMVRNGVYIVSIKVVRTGEYARMKVAVVK